MCDICVCMYVWIFKVQFLLPNICNLTEQLIAESIQPLFVA